MTVSGIRHGLDGKSYPATPLTRQQRPAPSTPPTRWCTGARMSIPARRPCWRPTRSAAQPGTIADDLARCDVPGCPGCPPLNSGQLKHPGDPSTGGGARDPWGIPR